MNFTKSFIFFLLLLTAFSCSSIKFDKRLYTKGYHVSKKSSSSTAQTTNYKELEPTKESVRILSKEELLPRVFLSSLKEDTVKVNLKNGKNYIGIITEESEKGIKLKLSDGRVIYLSRYEISEIEVLPQVQAKSSEENQSESNENIKKHPEEIYYEEDSKPKSEKNNSTYSRAYNSSYLDVPKQTDTAETFFYIALSALLYAPFLSPLFLLVGSFFNRKGYKIALANPDKYDMAQVEKIKKYYKILSLIMLIFLLFIIGIIVLIFII